MFGSRILEVAIGVVFVFLLVSIICSALRETLESVLKSRAAYLERGIRELLHDAGGVGLARALYQHPLISGLYTGNYVEGKINENPSFLARGGDLPSYIPKRNFAVALMDMAARGTLTDAVSGDPDSPPLTTEMMRRNVAGLMSPPVQRVILAALDVSQGDLERVRLTLEDWYDSSMDRVSGWYKRATSWVLFWIALVVVLALNVNAITLADYLYRNDAARQALVARAQTAATDTGYLHRSFAEAKATLDSTSLPIGWSKGWGAPLARSERRSYDPWFDVVGPIFGLLFTAVAATFGAPFWFDLLNKFMVIRSTVKPKEKSGEEGSEDRTQPDAPARATAPVVPRASAPAVPAAPAAAVAAVQPSFAGTAVRAPSPRDAASSVDGCEVEMAGIPNAARDEDLPPAEGGVE